MAFMFTEIVEMSFLARGKEFKGSRNNYVSNTNGRPVGAYSG